MATTETVRQMASQQQQASIDAAMSQSAAMNPDNKTPFQDQNEFLANEVKKIGEASEERARLTSERAREEYDNQVRGNIIKAKELAENRKQEADLVTAQNQQRNFAQAQAIAQQLNSIPIQPGENSYTMDNGKLAQIAKLTQEWNALRDRAPELDLMFLDERVFDPGFSPQQTQAQPAPEAHKGPRYQINKTDNGVEVRLATGEVFKGSADEVLDKLAKSKMDTRDYADGYKTKYEAAQQQLQQQPTSQQPDLGQQYSSIAEGLAAEQAEAFARQLGFSNKSELMQWGERYEKDRAMMENMRNEAVAADFLTKHPEFPNTDAASDAVAGVIAEKGWDYSPESLAAADTIARQRGLYQPLTQEQIAYANGASIQNTRPTPPPLVHGSNPESSFNQRTIEEMHWAQKPNGQWEYSLADLKKEIIRQQLGGQ